MAHELHLGDVTDRVTGDEERILGTVLLFLKVHGTEAAYHLHRMMGRQFDCTLRRAARALTADSSLAALACERKHRQRCQQSIWPGGQWHTAAGGAQGNRGTRQQGWSQLSSRHDTAVVLWHERRRKVALCMCVNIVKYIHSRDLWHRRDTSRAAALQAEKKSEYSLEWIIIPWASRTTHRHPSGDVFVASAVASLRCFRGGLSRT